MQIGRPPRHPDIRFAKANVLDYFYVSPRSPSPKYRLPLLSNSCRYRNCSKMRTTVITAAEGIMRMSFYIPGGIMF